MLPQPPPSRCKKRVKTWPLGLQADWIFSGAKRLSLEMLSGKKFSGLKRLTLETSSGEKILMSLGMASGGNYSSMRRVWIWKSDSVVKRKTFPGAKRLSLDITSAKRLACLSSSNWVNVIWATIDWFLLKVNLQAPLDSLEEKSPLLRDRVFLAVF